MRLAAVALLAALAGCPYSAPFEPAGRAVPLDPGLVGLWRCEPADGDSREVATLAIGRSAPGELLLTLTPPEREEEKPAQYRGRARRLASGLVVWSFREEGGRADVALGQVERKGDRVAFHWLLDDLLPEDPASPEALAAAIQAASGREGFRGLAMTCSRIHQES